LSHEESDELTVDETELEEILSYTCDESSDVDWELSALVSENYHKDLDDEESEMNEDFCPHLGRLNPGRKPAGSL
jgi:pyruvate-formate lyase-activating enzyme